MKVYNPLDRENLGNSVADALVTRPLSPLSEMEPFTGAGVYALYYRGFFSAYEKIRFDETELRQAATNLVPIYVGRAIPSGGRKGGAEIGNEKKKEVYNRLKKHFQSIDQVENLDVSDFCFRALIVDEIWIPLGEALLIARFRPVWNTLIDGFGNHAPGRGRQNQKRSRWDTLHPGRPYAMDVASRDESAADIERELVNYFSTH